ncbi:MAG: Coenzyme F420 hydrogenase/dehydrogenase, beta subunit C-terminal domain [Candidatus Thermoplasmatota archaeon]|nr:Coenzyme F420 hydrogenase/dehydrogenase, beta subunit C-terminal domain [Candidatus Thermoplasmatota archaeon]
MKVEGGCLLNGVGFEDLRREVVDAGLCTRCGGCVASCPVNVLEFGKESIVLIGDCIKCGACLRICPGKGVDMSAHEKRLFSRSRRSRPGGKNGIYQERRHLTSVSREFMKAGYFGGRVSSVLAAALEARSIDAALVTDWSDNGSLSTGKGIIARTKEEVIQAASSKYVFSSVLTLLPLVQKDPDIKKIAVVGLPCQVQAVRNMQADPALEHLTSKIEYLISLNCGAPNMSEDGWRATVSRLMDVPANNVRSFRYRKVSSTRIGLEVRTIDGNIITKEMLISSFLRNVNMGPKWPRCMFCPDYSGELSDISFGAPVIRTDRGMELVRNAEDRGYLKRSSFKKSRSQDITDLFVGYRKRRHYSRNVERRRRKKLPVPLYN